MISTYKLIEDDDGVLTLLVFDYGKIVASIERCYPTGEIANLMREIENGVVSFGNEAENAQEVWSNLYNGNVWREIVAEGFVGNRYTNVYLDRIGSSARQELSELMPCW